MKLRVQRDPSYFGVTLTIGKHHVGWSTVSGFMMWTDLPEDFFS